MPAPLGARSERLTRLRELLRPKGRRARTSFVAEGPTMLSEAVRSGAPIEEIYATPEAYRRTPQVAQCEAAGTPVYLVDERPFATLSDLESPTGIAFVAPARLRPLHELLANDGVLLVLADLADPANAGTLLRSSEAFGALGVAFGDRGVDPFHPKVVRGSMGAVFRLPMARATPSDLATAAASADTRIVGLRSAEPDVAELDWPLRTALVVGHERRGLGRWEAVCERFSGIRIAAGIDSLNAAVAGSIALYSAAEKRAVSQQKSRLPRP
jgi:TrmH family RNA methyltransferase